MIFHYINLLQNLKPKSWVIFARQGLFIDFLFIQMSSKQTNKSLQKFHLNLVTQFLWRQGDLIGTFKGGKMKIQGNLPYRRHNIVEFAYIAETKLALFHDFKFIYFQCLYRKTLTQFDVFITNYFASTMNDLIFQNLM